MKYFLPIALLLFSGLSLLADSTGTHPLHSQTQLEAKASTKEENLAELKQLIEALKQSNTKLSKLDNGFMDFAHLFNELKIKQDESQKLIVDFEKKLNAIHSEEILQKIPHIEKDLGSLKISSEDKTILYLLATTLGFSIFASLFAFIALKKVNNSSSVSLSSDKEPEILNEIENLKVILTDIQSKDSESTKANLSESPLSEEKLDDLHNKMDQLLDNKITEIDPLAISPNEEADEETLNTQSLNEAWPDAFQEGGKLYEWQETLKAAIQDKNTDALQLYASLISYTALHKNNDTGNLTIGHHIFKLSQDLYSYFEKDPNITEEMEVESMPLWINAFKQMLEARSPGLEINAFYPNETLNNEIMEKIGSGSKNTIQKALSWSVVDKSQENERILHQAQVITES